ncbi:MAG: hypothetical protein ACYTGH_19725, partial [Planctomycetota bacterium]
TWYYEKRRHSFTYQGAEVVLDEVPELGCFIEVEADSEEAIHRILGKLGLVPEAHENRSYLALFADHCQGRGEALREMRFPSGTP